MRTYSPPGHRKARAARISHFREIYETFLRALTPLAETPGMPELWSRVRKAADGLTSALQDAELELGRQGIVAVAQENARSIACASSISELELSAELNRLSRELGAAVPPKTANAVRNYVQRKAA
jgi:hypothetical protein